ncbi:MAG: hypothetical protein H6995_14985 [Pseudomonadales bacterium]|nr:hypothetical protein [Pseudomonadales bacterium]MCP5216304.1 hypothetical protein [Pseudomonadales bacterium]
MRGPKQLLDCEDKWVTEMGAWIAGERVVFRGKDLFKELHSMRWMGLLLYGITGREFNDKQIRLFEGLWVLSVSYPDARIWNNRVAALTGSAKATGSLGISAATAVSEAKVYGKQADLAAIEFIKRAKRHKDQGGDLTELVKAELHTKRAIGGFGRPIIMKDERIAPVMRLVKDLEYHQGECLKIAFEIEQILISERFRMRMNVGGLVAAIASDQNLSALEYYYYVLLAFTAGHFPCFIEAQDYKMEGTFFPLRCERVSYQGKPHRKWEI